ncbi:MAG: HD domain-containing protein [Candidatus Dormibacteria bacterium]
MNEHPSGALSAFREVNLVADPIYGYLRLTKRDGDVAASPGEAVEQDLVDHPWVQRMRRIHQLQSAWWVFPSAEHTRFQHVMGAMHLAGEIGLRLYDSLAETFADTPSRHVVEELLRVTGLLHDVGHGPFGHFFDDNHLAQYGLTHEIISQELVTGELAPMVAGLRRSPSGAFLPGESIDPAHVAHLIRKEGHQGMDAPPWLEALRPVFSGLYTADNMDYVPRDSYFCGVSVGPVDVRRILHYSFVGPRGLTLHKHGEFAALMFLNARMYLYNSVYFHRTVRAIDLHLRDIFGPTMELLEIGNPLENRERYRQLNEWFLINEMDAWARQPGDLERRRIGEEWGHIVDRRLRWKMNYETYLVFDDLRPGMRFGREDEYAERVRAHLPAALRSLDFRVDLASSDHRSLNPMADTGQVIVYDPGTGASEEMRTSEVLARMPVRTTLFRVFATGYEHREALALAARAALADAGAPSIATNV